MTFLITFLEGVVTFISPCLLPMLPIYVSYFAGGAEESPGRTARNALGFIAGFTLVFLALGAFAATLGGLLSRYHTAVNVIGGAIVVLFGLNYLGVFRLSLFRGSGPRQVGRLGFFSSLLFGLVFAVGWTPCVGAFLGSALLLASQQGSALRGLLLLLCYSAGLGIPFFLSAMLIGRLKTAFDWIKRHYDVINKVCGALLVLVGLFMATGQLSRLLSVFA